MTEHFTRADAVKLWESAAINNSTGQGFDAAIHDLANAAVNHKLKEWGAQEPVAKAVVLTTGIGLQWLGNPLPAGTALYTSALPAAITAGHEALKLRTCTWTQHDDVHMPSTYETECGALWSFVEGGPSENKTKFCHGCGGLVCEPIVGLQSTPDARPVGEPMQFLCDATRFKVRQHEGDEAGRIYGLPSELNGRWVALVAADDDCHIAAARTQAEN